MLKKLEIPAILGWLKRQFQIVTVVVTKGQECVLLREDMAWLSGSSV